MKEIATISSKRQLTIPAKIFKAAKMAEKQKVLVSQEEGRLVITPTTEIVKNLAGSLKTPFQWKGKDIDIIIEEAKKEYFAKKS